MTWSTIKTAITNALTGYVEADGKFLSLEELPAGSHKKYTIEVTGLSDRSISNDGTVGTVIVKLDVLFYHKDRDAYDTNVQSFSDVASTLWTLDQMLGFVSQPSFARVNNQPDKHKATYIFYYGIRTN